MDTQPSRPPRGSGAYDAELHPEALFNAGQAVAAGIYHQLDGCRTVHLEHEDVLPASCDGHVAVYLRRPPRWGDRTPPADATRETGGRDGPQEELPWPCRRRCEEHCRALPVSVREQYESLVWMKAL